jgi:hypothetical protein
LSFRSSYSLFAAMVVSGLLSRSRKAVFYQRNSAIF